MSAAFFLTGGDTAISFMEKNHAHGARLVEEVLPIVALVETVDGDYPGLPLVVKGGPSGMKMRLQSLFDT